MAGSVTWAASRAAWTYYKDLLLILTQKEIKVRYKSSWLGYAWSVAHPLAFALLYFIALGIFMRVQIPHYPVFLIAGLFPWQWMANSLNAAPLIFLANASLLKKVPFPRSFLVASVVLNDAIHFLFSIPVILVFLLAYRQSPSWAWLPGIPLLMLAQFMTAYGLALAVASLNLLFRDLERLITLMVTFLFFLTPIVYPASMVPIQYQMLLELNPVAPLILSWQRLFLSGQFDGLLMASCYAYAGLCLGLGLLVYWKLCWRFAEVV